MKSIFIILALSFGVTADFATVHGTLENAAIAWHWRLDNGVLRPAQLDDKLNGTSLPLNGECFQLALENGDVLKASDFKLAAPPQEEALGPEPDSPTPARHFAGRQIVAKFMDTNRNISAEWRVVLRDGSTYVREELDLRAHDEGVLVRAVVLFDEKIPGAATVGTVDGSPVVAGNYFFGYEHPMAQNVADGSGEVRCSFVRNALLRAGETLEQSCVLGVAPAGQLRRGFLAYLERERAHPYRPFLHYNSWFDIAWDTRKYNEKECLDAIRTIGEELAVKRGVSVDSFLFDDGWDDDRTLWKFHNGFPDGFSPLKAAAAHYDAGIGVWLSPFGGYNHAKEERLKCGYELGFETNANGFSLAGPKYYRRFHDICLEMVQKYGVNQFKFDGLAAGARASENGLMRDGDGMMRLIADLRAAKPDIYINETTGTWPSPFWLLDVDSTWRGGADHDFQGKGSWCQQWMTYRDAQTYQNVVQRGPLYPLNSLMLHGIIYAANATHLKNMSDTDFASQVREFFGSGTQLQEMYITPKLLNQQNWDDLAAAAKWAQRNADVLVDVHWIGGDPAQGKVYGYAAWSPCKAILVLRNPGDKPAVFNADARRLFELPPGVATHFVLRSPWKEAGARPAMVLEDSKPSVIKLKPFEVAVLEDSASR